jgi:hypothetical protein
MRLVIIIVPTTKAFYQLSFQSRFWANLPLWQISFPSEPCELLTRNSGDLPFSSSHPNVVFGIVQSCSIQYNLTALHHRIRHCTIPCASFHNLYLTSVFLTLSKSVSNWCNLECILYNLVVIDCFIGLLYIVVSLKSTSPFLHWFHLVHLTLCWLSSSTLFVALTLVDSIAPKSYLSKLTMIVHGHLGRLLQSITIPYRERKSIAGLVTFSWLLNPCNWSRIPWVKLIEGRFTWLMSSSKLQSFLELCRFTRAFLKPKIQIESACLIGLAKGFHTWSSSEQDGILLEIRNQNEEGCGWSLVATTSFNLAIMSLPWCQISMNTSITMFVSSPFVVT